MKRGFFLGILGERLKSKRLQRRCFPLVYPQISNLQVPSILLRFWNLHLRRLNIVRISNLQVDCWFLRFSFPFFPSSYWFGASMNEAEAIFGFPSFGSFYVGYDQAIESLRNEGAGLERMDKEGKTPLILASMSPQLYDAAKTLIELGANVNAYRPGRHAGTVLHHAAKSGLEQMVTLMLSHGANALMMNDDCQTALDVARLKGYSNVVRAIENHICLFSGWLQELLMSSQISPKF